MMRYSVTARFFIEVDGDPTGSVTTQIATAIQFAGGRQTKIRITKARNQGKKAPCSDSTTFAEFGKNNAVGGDPVAE